MVKNTQKDKSMSQAVMDTIERVSKEFYTPEARLEMRKAGFGRAALHANIKKEQLNEFM